MYSEILGLSFNAETQTGLTTKTRRRGEERGPQILKMLKTYIFSYTAGSGVPALPRSRTENDPHNHPLKQKKCGADENKRVERVIVTRIDPLKAMQVVDFPDIEENKGFNAKAQRRRDAKKTKSNETGPTDPTYE